MDIVKLLIAKLANIIEAQQGGRKKEHMYDYGQL